MEQYTLSNESLATNEPLTAPHFDDEATLVSARPVVPLQQVKEEARSKRRLGFGLAIAGALVAGALGASVIYKQRDEPQQSVSSEVVKLPAKVEPADSSNGFVSATGEASGAAIDSNQHPSAGPASDPSDAKSVPAPTVIRTQTARADRRRTDEQVRTSDVAQYDEDQILQDEIEQRREERREERRLWRERRNRRERSSEGVNRIREIFEGRPRP